jgi:3-hydroxyisobutyrate dehydrogenase-like beta-hydroxyacid dehydrogenase
VTPRVGFIGVGKIGRPMAARLVAAGLDPLVFDVSAGALQAIAGAGARVAASAREVGERCDVIGICVPADTHVRAVCEGPDGVFAGARPGTVVAVHSTVRPATVRALGEAGAARGVGVVDACISGGEIGAAEGTLVYMVGGDAAHVERCRPAFEASAKRIVHIGALGTGTLMKLCNNLMSYVTFRATYEACRLAQGMGLPDGLLEEVTSAGGILSTPMQRYLNIPQMAPEVVANATLQAMLTEYLDIGDKDMAIALEAAAELGLDLPVARLCAERMAETYRVVKPPSAAT